MNHLTLSIRQLSMDNIRKMQGVCYSGGVLTYHGEHIAIDLKTLQIPQKQIPLLHNHDRERVVGYGYLRLDENQSALLVDGTMLSNPAAEEITQAADEGLSWQLSVHVESGTVNELEAGQMVNGKALLVKTRVFQNAQIREVSFTPTGVDANTHAAILSLNLQPKQETTMTPEQIQQLQAENTKLQAEIAQLKQAQIYAERQAKLSVLGLPVEKVNEAFLSMSEEAFANTLALLQSASMNAPSPNTQQAHQSAHQRALLGESYQTPQTPSQRPNPLL